MTLERLIKKEEYCQQVVDLFSIIGDAIRKLGFENLKQRIYRMSESSDNPLRKELEIKILKWVSDETQVSVDDIVNSNKRGWTYTAKKITFILFKNELGMSEYRISKYFNRTPPIVGRATKEFKNLNEKLKSDKKVLLIYNNVLNNIIKFKEETDFIKAIQ